jgi:hypothetical protein
MDAALEPVPGLAARGASLRFAKTDGHFSG